MTVESDTYDYLAGLASLTALLGTGIGADEFRVYPQRLPQNPSYPSVVYTTITAPRRAYTHDQAGNPPLGSTLVARRIQFDLWAAKDTDGAYEELLPVRDALVAALSGFQGTMGTGYIQKVFIDNETDSFEPDTGANRRTVDAIFHYEEVAA